MTETSETSTLPPPAAPHFLRSRREIWIAIGAFILGMIITALTALLITVIAGGVLAVVKPHTISDAVKACHVTSNEWITVGDAGQSVSMKTKGEETDGADVSDVACVLRKLHVPDSVTTRIDTTRALDGHQTATWSGLSASWGYHPDDGLDIVVEEVQK